jgi:hypothetical protein
MHTYPNAWLTSLSRERLLRQHIDHGEPLADLAAQAGIACAPPTSGWATVRRLERRVIGPGSLLLFGSGPLQALLPPEPVHPLVVHRLALPPQQAVGHPPSSGCAHPRFPISDNGAWPPQDQRAFPDRDGYCDVGQPPCRRSVLKPETWREGPQQPCRTARCALQRNVVPRSEVPFG